MPLETKAMSYADRAQLCSNVCARDLFQLMEDKKTNLALAADVTSKKQLLHLADTLGPEICVLKTHIDIIDDFDADLITQLSALALKHNFMIFEDRKFADIGNTSKMQYQGGIFRIADWSHVINAHILPGPGIIDGLAEVGVPLGRGLLLIAELSSEGSLATGEYTKQAVQFAKKCSDFVIGYISRRRVDENPCLLTMTPGVKLNEGKDNLGQQYLTPRSVIIDNLSDIIIVGRDIISAASPLNVARQYREIAWKAYQERSTENK